MEINILSFLGFFLDKVLRKSLVLVFYLIFQIVHRFFGDQTRSAFEWLNNLSFGDQLSINLS